MRLLRWAALDGNRILALETFSLIYLFISGISVGVTTILVRVIIGWTSLAATYMSAHAALLAAVSVATGGLEIGHCGGAVFASQFGLATGFSLMLGYARNSEDFSVQSMAGVTLGSTIYIYLAFFAPQPPKLQIALPRQRWVLDSHAMYWNMRGFWLAAAIGSGASSMACFGITAGELTLRVPSFAHAEVMPFRRVACQANPKASGCSANDPIDVPALFMFYTFLAVFVAEQSVRQRRGEVLESQRGDSAMRGDFEAAFGEQAAREGAWRRGLEGHRCVTPSEAEAGANSEGSLMYGELAPAGARCVGDALLLASKDGGKVVDVGMGAGKVALQWFLEHQNLSTVVGVEKVESRFRLAEAACVNLAENSGGRFGVEGDSKKGRVELVELGGRRKGRKLKLLLDDAWDVESTADADAAAGQDSIVGLEVADADACLINLCIDGDVARRGVANLLGRIRTVGARIACYSHLKVTVGTGDGSGQIKSNRLVHRGEVEALTSWSNEYGHSFHVYEMR